MTNSHENLPKNTNDISVSNLTPLQLKLLDAIAPFLRADTQKALSVIVGTEYLKGWEQLPTALQDNWECLSVEAKLAAILVVMEWINTTGWIDEMYENL